MKSSSINNYKGEIKGTLRTRNQKNGLRNDLEFNNIRENFK